MNRISVIIPAYNSARYIEEAVRSVLGQHLKPDEIIIVDDGSTDETPEILAGFTGPGIITIRQENSGAASARNRGIQAATGSLIAFLDSDDIWLPEKLAAQNRVLTEHPEIAYVLCGMEDFISPEQAEKLKLPGALPENSRSGTLPTTALIRKPVFDKVGLFNPGWKTGEFMDWLLRANEAGVPGYRMEQILVRRRIHDRNLGRSAASGRDYHQILKAALDRKRKQRGNT